MMDLNMHDNAVHCLSNPRILFSLLLCAYCGVVAVRKEAARI